MVTASHPRLVIAEMLEREGIKKTKVMEAVDWAPIGNETERLFRLCGSVCSVKTFQELVETRKKECPNLKRELIESLVAAHFPKDQRHAKTETKVSTSSESEEQEETKEEGVEKEVVESQAETSNPGKVVDTPEHSSSSMA